MHSDRLTHLRVKIVVLAHEARIIRLEEHKALNAHRAAHAVALERPVRVRGGAPAGTELVHRLPPEHAVCPSFVKLHHHRTGPVRAAARANQLACGFLRGVPYAAIEGRVRADVRARWPDFDAVCKVVRAFAEELAPEGETWARWIAWRDAGLAHVEAQRAARKVA